ncbi:MAG: hypothetical protein JHC31_11195 [Sulfurihydrogenibium sp.]|nr:hypothetical protein [Sulfurihydrogenibium sp.]
MKISYWHEFIIKNKVEYTEIIQNDLTNYYADYYCIPTILHSGTIEFKIRGENITLKISKIKSEIVEEGELRIYLRQVEKDWDIVIKQEDRNLIIGRNFNQVFFGNLEIEILFK